MTEDNWRAALAEALIEARLIRWREPDLAAEYADAMLPAVRRIVTEELRAAAEIRASDWPAARALILYRADTLDRTVKGVR